MGGKASNYNVAVYFSNSKDSQNPSINHGMSITLPFIIYVVVKIRYAL